MEKQIEIKNAIIESTMFGYEDHGILTCMLHLGYGSGNQGFGGYEISRNASFWIKRILEVVGVSKWEDLVGEHIRVKGNRMKIDAIGNFLEDKWFEPEVEMKKQLKTKL